MRRTVALVEQRAGYTVTKYGPIALVMHNDLLRAHVANRCGHCHEIGTCFVCRRAVALTRSPASPANAVEGESTELSDGPNPGSYSTSESASALQPSSRRRGLGQSLRT